MVRTNKNGIKIYTEEDFAGMRKAGQVAAECLDYIADYVKVGVSTGELDDLCNEFMKSKGAVSACIGYHGYPKATCISINQVICHGIPDYERKLADGDILNIDVTAIVDGYFGDTSRMYFAGKPKVKGKRLCDVTYECMMRGIEVVKPGAHFGDIGAVIEEYAHKYGYSVVDMFCGHGVGMIFTIEPMINMGKKDGVILSNGWTAVTCDHAWSAQFEHSLGVTKDGYEIFTYSPKGMDKPPYK